MTPETSAIYNSLLTMPKAELHVHLEGAIQPQTLLQLAQQNNRWRNLPGRTEGTLREWFRFTDFPHFIEIYTAISDLLRSPDDFALITHGFAAEMARQNIRYAEVTVTPYTHTHLQDKGLTIDDIFVGLDQGRLRATNDFGVEIAWIFDMARNVSFRPDATYAPGPAETTLAYAIEGMRHGVIGFGLGGNEIGAPPAPFAHAFEVATKAGLYSLPHAGEIEGPASVWSAIHALGARRIGHGVRSIEDTQLLAYLKQNRIPLEICITSNLCLHVYKRRGHHPFLHLDKMGIVVTLNSDDPPLFNTDLTQEYVILMEEFGYPLSDVVRIARNSFHSAYISNSARTTYLAELDDWYSKQAITL